jgi:hypothetical protein
MFFRAHIESRSGFRHRLIVRRARAMHETPRRTNRAVWSDPCRQFFQLLGLSAIWFVVAGAVGFTWSRHGVIVTGVLWFLAAVFVLLPWLLAKLLNRGQEHQEHVGPRNWLRGYLEIATGRLEAREFAIQALIAPVGAALGLSLLAVVLALVA